MTEQSAIIVVVLIVLLVHLPALATALPAHWELF